MPHLQEPNNDLVHEPASEDYKENCNSSDDADHALPPAVQEPLTRGGEQPQDKDPKKEGNEEFTHDGADYSRKQPRIGKGLFGGSQHVQWPTDAAISVATLSRGYLGAI